MKSRNQPGTLQGALAAALIGITLLLSACRAPAQQEAASPTGMATASQAAVLVSPTLASELSAVTQTPHTAVSSSDLLPPTVTQTPATATPVPSLTPLPSATANPYAGLGIADLAAREYGAGELDIIDTLEETDTYTRYLITYPSDGLTIYGFLSVPNEGSKFPVAIVAHGYIPPQEYQTEAYTTRYADALTEAGFFVIHPNFRNYPPSDEGDNPFRTGYAIDLLNLIAIVQEQSRHPHGYLRRADGENIHLMGHSMGGGVVLRVATVWPEAVKALVLYGSMSGDETKNYARIQEWSGGIQGQFELAASPADLLAIAPIHHLDRLRAAVSIHHSLDDDTVPAAWSEELCGLLQAIRHPVECFTYENTPHTFNGYADTLFIERMIAFFRQY